MDKLNPEVREAVSALEEIFNPEGMQGESNWQIVRDELHRLTEQVETLQAERDALRECAKQSKWVAPDYRTSKGNKYSVVTFPKGESVTELFDAGEWLRAAHAAVFVLSRYLPDRVLRIATEDDGILHELLHLACGIDICTNTTMADLRRECMHLDKAIDKARIVPEQEGSS